MGSFWTVALHLLPVAKHTVPQTPTQQPANSNPTSTSTQTFEKGDWQIDYPSSLKLVDNPNNFFLHFTDLAAGIDGTIVYAPASERPSSLSAFEGSTNSLLGAVLNLERSGYAQGADQVLSSQIIQVGNLEAAQFVTFGGKYYSLATSFTNGSLLVDVNLMTNTLSTQSASIQTYNEMLRSFRFR